MRSPCIGEGHAIDDHSADVGPKDDDVATKPLEHDDIVGNACLFQGVELVVDVAGDYGDKNEKCDRAAFDPLHNGRGRGFPWTR